MPALPLLLGIDLGTTNIKAIVFDTRGHMHGFASEPTPSFHPRPGWTEHHAEVLWNATVTAIKRALSEVDATQVRGVGVASVGEAGVLVDARGRQLGPMIAWHDGRTTPQFRQWQAHVEPGLATRQAGMPPRPIYTLFKLMWLRENAPDAYQHAARWLLVADYVVYRLCGAQITDYSLASRTLLFDLRARRWSRELLDSAGLRHDLLPDLVPAGEPVGTISPEAAAATGLTTETIVGSGGHDHIVGALAAGVVRAGQCLDSLGTAEAVFLPFDQAPPDAIVNQTSCTIGAHVARNRLFALEGLWSGGASVAWARSILTPGEPGFAALERLAAGAQPASGGAMFLPRLAGGERGAFVGLSTATGPAEMARAVYEGLAFEWRRYLERIEQVFGLHADSIRVIGGGARSAIWVQTKADVLGRRLSVLELEESVALGAALLGGLAAGVYA
ncbi:MAG TPA: FGGY family carbohydrate kinase, partial [Roseiflexaceae bacterium]|nr:FGGY family carbohydrate kinase [Roseiflexaceae bacterium]